MKRFSDLTEQEIEIMISLLPWHPCDIKDLSTYPFVYLNSRKDTLKNLDKKGYLILNDDDNTFFLVKKGAEYLEFIKPITRL